jgi:hypothetical protein
MTTKAFKDTSIFYGWKEFTTDTGEEVRAEERGLGAYSVYVKSRDSFIHSAIVEAGRNASCRKIWDAYLELEYEE